mmetsp:Transcript_9184/g.13588  ORF Transcript_9184/g.13588 Transcript_9184/m.13588 type:complete len:597 (+) Transcript_9184:23-1813(+)
MREDLYLDETHFDAVVVGTGVTEALVSGSLSRAGRKVLNLDPTSYYGSQFASLTLMDMAKFATTTNKNQIDEIELSKQPLQDDETNIKVEHNMPYTIYESTKMNLEDINIETKRRYNRYCLDLHSKFIFCYGDLVKLFLDSDTARMMDFQGVVALLQYVSKEDGFVKVPCSKGEIFKHAFISLNERRLLMKFMKYCLDGNIDKEKEEGKYDNFSHFLDKKFPIKKLKRTVLKEFILYAIAFLQSEEDAKKLSAKEGIHLIMRYIQSLGKHGTTSSFLYPLYGISEIPQSFVRVGAVCNAIHILERGIKNIYSKVEENRITGIETTPVRQKLTTNHLIINEETIPKSDDIVDEESKMKSIVRAIYVVDKPLFDVKQYTKITDPRQVQNLQNGIIVGFVPPYTFSENQHYVITITQMDHTAKVCPKGEYVITFQMACRSENDHVVLKTAITSLLNKSSNNEKVPQKTIEKEEQIKEGENQEKVEFEQETTEEKTEDDTTETIQKKDIQEKQRNIIYHIIYSKKIRKESSLKGSNIYLVPGVSPYIYVDDCIEKARKIFHSICPNELFLEKFPNPDEDLIYDETAKALGVDKDEEENNK